ncbi:hypothetical protein DM01DRAFT_301846 [Hesseltinella vesiculosa]|uniref:Uncharacterized protein n=1 Tax=Hesseltinella vesiculosa TaxID=101127 RepID=A0A1X2GNH9_9FUNG|nr:hypothetical protein DM01DRAFT_301846 [Hesseltinella vesiculosa]
MQHSDDINQQKMKQILRKFESENDQQDLRGDQDDDLLDRFADMDIAQTDPDTLWRMLSNAERQQFQAMLGDNQDPFQSLDMPTFEPWWFEVDTDAKESNGQESSIPPKPTEPLPPLSKLLKTTPSPTLRYHVIHLLMTYAYLHRKTMGDLADDPEFLLEVLQNMSVLFATTSTSTLLTLDQVILDVQQHLQEWEGQDKDEAKLVSLLLKDAEQLVAEDDFVVHAVGELYQLLDWIKHQPTTKAKKPWIMAGKKAYFFLVYAQALSRPERQAMSMAIQSRHQRLDMEQQVFQQHRQAAELAIKQKQKHKLKIQEL